MTSGQGELRNLDFLGGEVALTDAVAGEPVIVRANYYPAWRATVNGHDVPLYDSGGQLAFSRAGDRHRRREAPVPEVPMVESQRGDGVPAGGGRAGASPARIHASLKCACLIALRITWPSASRVAVAGGMK